jgi:myo-inositol-1-phosphate synthase
LLDYADRRGEGGAQEQFGAFFKAPMTVDGLAPEHALHRQEETLAAWLGAERPARMQR